ncbi:MAG: GAF domain-containing protein [Chloroflexi bacterium]|nr:GAF domain-containing protein [Chloroflexota bacterium]
MNSYSAMLRKFQRLNLWPRLAIAVSLGFLLLFGVFSLLSLRAVNDSTDRILQERLVIAQMAAREIDGLLERSFYELEKATEFAAFNPQAPSLGEEYHMLAHSYGRIGTLSLGVHFLDAQGRVVLSEPPDRLPQGADLSTENHVRQVIQTRSRSVSDPFVDPATSRPAVALTIPIFAPDGALISLLTGLIDLSSVEVISPLEHARDLGHTGHAELVDSRGLVVAATGGGGFLKPGEHLSYYLKRFKEGGPGVENVPYVPWHPLPEGVNAGKHVMAFAPLTSAPWGLSVGGTDSETFAPARKLRNTIFLAGALTLAFLWVLTLIGARLLVRPVRALTTAAQRMTSGNLGESIKVPEGGEIGVLGESLEAMRVQLRSSLDQVRRWGEELEVKVAQRTEELAARNRQLAAVSAVATAANEIRDQDGMLNRCLEVVLEHTRMDAAAIRLLDGASNHLVVAGAKGDYLDLPCANQAVGLHECPCGYVASNGIPLYLGHEERQRFQPVCQAPLHHAVSVLPLKSPKGVLGVLYLSRGQGVVPSSEERNTLAAICNQIAVAIESANLLGELRRVEAQRELDRIKAEFISAISHELRTPLGFIKGYATTLLRDDISVDPATRQEFLQVIDEESTKLQRMIDELLDASRLQAGRLQMDRTSVSLRGLLEAALHRATPGLQQAGHALEVTLPTESTTVLADAGRIEQVLHNLLDNAARYSDPGSPIEVAATVSERRVFVSVKDHGDGISTHELERVFEPFYRGENSRRRGAWGAGLGLAICKGIVESHGGHLGVESTPGAGSTFLFTLPLAERAEAEGTEQELASTVMKKGEG